MKKTTITVQTKSGGIPWPAYTTSTPGLAVCHNYWEDWDNPGEYKVGDGWRVVHIASGKTPPGCRDFRTRRDAKMMAWGLARVTDWEQSEEELSEASRFDLEDGKGWPGQFAEIKQGVFGK